ncbi:MAG: erythromycin biosynthesis sensory transduction protein eryC1 [Candidatus Hydrogenedentota bacterium]|nr:MAG: erythromycin biosynthesis sensory transduction protein eryC1 [Candidatus Hydrogenedentota bacterium]
MIPFGDLRAEFGEIGPEIHGAVNRVLESGWFVLGEEVRAFEEEFSSFVGVNHAVGVGNGTDAIQLALQALGVGAGDEVITAANTCVPTLTGICATGAVPRLVDVTADTLVMDYGSLEKAITDRTKAIVPVHLYGHPCPMSSIMAIAGNKNLVVVEDCAQAHGATLGGKQCGTFGHTAAFSFYPSKNLGAYGDGGAVVTSDQAVADKVTSLRNYGQTERYYHDDPGVNSRLDEIQAAILRTKLPYLKKWNERRRELASRYTEGLKNTPLTIPVEEPGAESSWHLYVVRTSNRDGLQQHLKDKGIGTVLHYPVPIHLQKAFAAMGYVKGDFPASEQACDEVLSLPLYPYMPEEHVDTVVKAIREFFG